MVVFAGKIGKDSQLGIQINVADFLEDIRQLYRIYRIKADFLEDT